MLNSYLFVCDFKLCLKNGSSAIVIIFLNCFRSFVPPVRDEESETQRKAHAKRVRETRRSTQGVTLEEIKSAEQIVKSKNQSSITNNNNNEQVSSALLYLFARCFYFNSAFNHFRVKLLSRDSLCLIHY